MKYSHNKTDVDIKSRYTSIIFVTDSSAAMYRTVCIPLVCVRVCVQVCVRVCGCVWVW